jgi:hypothetical protein
MDVNLVAELKSIELFRKGQQKILHTYLGKRQNLGNSQGRKGLEVRDMHFVVKKSGSRLRYNSFPSIYRSKYTKHLALMSIESSDVFSQGLSNSTKRKCTRCGLSMST